MTQYADIVNRSLQLLGTRTTVTQAELTAQSSNEAIQAQIAIDRSRRQLLRMAPWSCSLKTANLVYISSVPGTPENTSPATALWQPGQPPLNWTYEYQYPVDCLRACWLTGSANYGYTGIPIQTAQTGGLASLRQRGPIPFKVQTDSFYTVSGATPVAGGNDNAVGDVLTLATTIQGNAPIGAPAQLNVTSISGSGVITGVSVVNIVNGEANPSGGSYFAKQINTVGVSATTGLGDNTATFNLTYNTPGPQRVVLTNLEYAAITYCGDVTDPNIFDDQFLEAWVDILAALMCNSITGSDKLINMLLQQANARIQLARVDDANEGLTINDVTPDWIRARGYGSWDEVNGGYGSFFNWGGGWGQL